jgi:hypothetical protein
MKRCAFGAKATEVCGMIGVTTHCGDLLAVGRCEHAAADTAIRASGLDFNHVTPPPKRY